MNSVIPFDDPFNLPDNVCIDLANSRFSNDFIENINTAFIYLRNIEYAGSVDMSGCTYDQKAQILKLYMLRDIKDLNIRVLDYTVLDLMIDTNVFQYGDCMELRQMSVFSEDEKARFIRDNIDMLTELNQLIISLPLYVLSLDRDRAQQFEIDVNKTDVVPKTYECCLMLLSYPAVNFIQIISPDMSMYRCSPIFFTKVFRYENAELADRVVKLSFSYLYNDIVQYCMSEKNAE